jgi:hypothetical protein
MQFWIARAEAFYVNGVGLRRGKIVIRTFQCIRRWIPFARDVCPSPGDPVSTCIHMSSGLAPEGSRQRERDSPHHSPLPLTRTTHRSPVKIKPHTLMDHFDCTNSMLIGQVVADYAFALAP